MEAKLKVNEIFTTFQGEGASMGRNVTFLRLSVCNLHCRWCDTWYTWNFGKGDGVEERFGSKTVKMADEVHEMTIDEVAAKLRSLEPRRVVISGGEPMIQQNLLVKLICTLKNISRPLKEWEEWEFEIETNGTIPFIEPSGGYSISGLLDQINCSPKLESSGNPVALRYKPDVLRSYLATHKAYFKFVITEPRDLEEVQGIIKNVGIPPERVYLMPQGKTKAEQEQFQGAVAALAQQEGFNFSPRLHILVYDSKRGV